MKSYLRCFELEWIEIRGGCILKARKINHKTTKVFIGYSRIIFIENNEMTNTCLCQGYSRTAKLLFTKKIEQ